MLGPCGGLWDAQLISTITSYTMAQAASLFQLCVIFLLEWVEMDKYISMTDLLQFEVFFSVTEIKQTRPCGGGGVKKSTCSEITTQHYRELPHQSEKVRALKAARNVFIQVDCPLLR